MTAFFASLGPFGWIVLALLVFGLLTLPRALREMWTRPWKKESEPSIGYGKRASQRTDGPDRHDGTDPR